MYAVCAELTDMVHLSTLASLIEFVTIPRSGRMCLWRRMSRHTIANLLDLEELGSLLRAPSF